MHVPDSENSQESPKKKNSKFCAWVGKDKTTWWRKNVSEFHGRTKSSNIIKFRQGLIGPSVNANYLIDFGKVFITPDIIKLLIKFTNIVFATKKQSYGESCRIKDTKIIEMKPLIGLLMLVGVYQSNRLNLVDAWKVGGTGMEVFRLTMSLDRFRFLLCCLVLTIKQHGMKERRKISLPYQGKYFRCLYNIAKITIFHRNV